MNKKSKKKTRKPARRPNKEAVEDVPENVDVDEPANDVPEIAVQEPEREVEPPIENIVQRNEEALQAAPRLISPNTDSGLESGRGTPSEGNSDNDSGLINIKHPLEYTWSFWTVDHDADWDKALSRYFNVSTIEDFWHHFHYLKDFASSMMGMTFFKQGIVPEWEDSRNQQGGRWGIQSRNGDEINKVWFELVLMIIGGEAFGPETEYINGIFATKKCDVYSISVWLSTMRTETVKRIGVIIRDNIHLHTRTQHKMEFFSLFKNRKKPLHGL